MTKSILFLDLDGTLIKTSSGNTFPKDRYDMEPVQGVFEAIKRMHESNPLSHIFIISNQGGVSLGYQTDEDVKYRIERTIRELSAFVNDDSIHYDYRYATSNDPADPMRKPNIGMIEHLLQFVETEDLDLLIDCSLMVGDASGKPGDWSDSDRRTAEKCGMDYMGIEDFIVLDILD